MKRVRAICCAVLAGLMLAGCGSKEVITCRAEGPAAAVDLTQYAVKEAAYPAYPAEPRFEDYFDENGEGDWDAYDAAYTEYREALQKLGKLDAEPDGGAVLAFANRTLGRIFADSENRVYSPISLYAALSMLTEMTDGDTKQQVMDLLNSVDGIENVSNGQETGDEEVHIVIDKDKAMRLGLTVAQVYQQIAAKLSTDTTATTLKVGRDTYDVTIVDKTDTPNLNDLFQMEFITTTTDDDGNTVNETHTLGEFASRTNGNAYATIARENGSRKISVTSDTAEGYNTTLISRDLSPQLEALDLPDGCTAEIAGETTQVTEMIQQMAKMMALALLFVYFVMVAQFQIGGEQLSVISLMGFLVLMGVVVNNGIVFVDYANQLRIGGLERTDALVATGRTRMRPILMTTLTTVLAMVTMIFSKDAGSEMGKGMAIVIVGGLSYATLMTLFIVPVMYDLFYRKPPVNIDVGDDGMDDLPDDAAEFAAEFAARRAAEGKNQPEPETPDTAEHRRLKMPGKPDTENGEGTPQ